MKLITWKQFYLSQVGPNQCSAQGSLFFTVEARPWSCEALQYGCENRYCPWPCVNTGHYFLESFWVVLSWPWIVSTYTCADQYSADYSVGPFPDLGLSLCTSLSSTLSWELQMLRPCWTLNSVSSLQASTGLLLFAPLCPLTGKLSQAGNTVVLTLFPVSQESLSIVA